MSKPNDGGLASEKSLRAHFAGKAMQGLIASEVDGHEWSPSLYKRGALLAGKLARLSCEAADALIAELEKKVAVQLPEGREFKFQLGDKVRLRKGDPERSWSEGVVRERSWTLERGLIYELAVKVNGKPGSVWMPEDELEAVDEPLKPVTKFKERQLVRVKPNSPTRHHGRTGIVDSIEHSDPPGGAWAYMVQLDANAGGPKMPVVFDESELEAWNGEGPAFMPVKEREE